MGKALIEEIVIPERDKNGPFKSICDFAKRVDSTKFNKKSWEAAIKTGAFDSFGYSRSDLLFNLENIQAYGAKCQKDTASGQTDLFGAFGDAGAIPEPEIKPAPTEFSEKEQLLWERDLMGLYISAHPLDKYDTFFDEQTHPYSLITPENDGKVVTVGGIITSVRTILTKKSEKMAFVKIENKTSETEVIVFPSIFTENADKFAQDNVIKVTGRINAKDKNGNTVPDPKVLVEAVEVVSDETLKNYKATGLRLASPMAAEKPTYRRSKSSAERVSSIPIPEPARVPIAPPKDTRNERLYLLLENPDDTKTLTEIRRLCDVSLGIHEVILVFKENDKKTALKMPFKVDFDSEFVGSLKNLLGEEKVKIQ